MVHNSSGLLLEARDLRLVAVALKGERLGSRDTSGGALDRLGAGIDLRVKPLSTPADLNLSLAIGREASLTDRGAFQRTSKTGKEVVSHAIHLHARTAGREGKAQDESGSP